MKIYTIGWAMTSGCQEACDTCATDPWEAISWELKQCWPTARCDVTRWDGETEGISWDIGGVLWGLKPPGSGKMSFLFNHGIFGVYHGIPDFFGNPDEYWIGWTEHDTTIRVISWSEMRFFGKVLVHLDSCIFLVSMYFDAYPSSWLLSHPSYWSRFGRGCEPPLKSKYGSPNYIHFRYWNVQYELLSSSSNSPMFFLLSPSFHDRVTTGQVVDSLSALRKDNAGNLDGEDGFPLGWTWWFSMWFIMGRWPMNANKHVGIQWYIWLYVKVKVI